jgi:hypothetical protein
LLWRSRQNPFQHKLLRQPNTNGDGLVEIGNTGSQKGGIYESLC